MTYSCVDAGTEILTRRGWLRYDQIREGDETLSLNRAVGLSEWQPVSSLHIFDGPHDVTEMSSTTHSSVTTGAHRWPVVKRKTGLTGWTTTATMARDDRVWRAAPVQAPAEANWSDSLVELVAWLWTEGHVRSNGMVEIEQSQAVNPANVGRIRAALRDLFGEPVESLRPYGHPQPARPAWREDRHGKLVRFRLSGAAGRLLTEHAPGKVMATSWLAELTRAQLELFIQVSVDADGFTRPNGARRIAQRDRARVDAFQVACALAGYAGSVRQTARGFWFLEVGGRPWCAPAQPRYITRRSFTGVVWCPVTPHQNWFARRNGTTYFTGQGVALDAQNASPTGRGCPGGPAVRQHGPDLWLAQRRDNRETLRAESAAELLEKIRTDYAQRPVPRPTGADRPQPLDCRFRPEG